jgi:hypothetical protein
MHDIEDLIMEYCTQNLPPEPVWIMILNQRFPKIARHLNGIKPVRWEIQDHLRNSYEAFLSKGQNPELAWKSAQEHFGDVALISQEIRRTRIQSHKCLTIRVLAIITLFALPVGNTARLRIIQFFQPSLLFFLAACVLCGFLVTRRSTAAVLRKYVYYGAWIGLVWGLILVANAGGPAELGAGVATILLSTFYGLFLAAPGAGGFIPATMMVLCQIGVLIPCERFGILSLHHIAIDASLLKTVAAFSIVSVLVGLTVFDVRRLHRRFAGLAAFSMVYGYTHILINLTRDNGSVFYILCATSIPPLMAMLIALPIQKLQGFLLRETN